MLTSAAQAASKLALALPPVRGVGLFLEYASRIFSGVDAEIVTRFEGSALVANPSITDGRRLLFTARYHDRTERAFVRSVLRPGDYAVDVGANIGLYTLLFARLVGPTGMVTAIEAEPVNARRLRRNVALNDHHNVTVRENGASNKSETLSLHLSGTNLGMHSFARDEGRGDVAVECLPLSELLEPRQPRLLKIDIEGFEYRVLARYFEDTPRDLRPQHIMIEDWPHLREGDSVKLCEANGYRVLERFSANFMMVLD